VTKSTLASRILSVPIAQGEARERLISMLQLIHRETGGTMNLHANFCAVDYSTAIDPTHKYARARLFERLTGRPYAMSERGDGDVPFDWLVVIANRALGLHDNESAKARAELAECYLTKKGELRKRPTR
jgi:hypothetical protein